jgi:hypothetical protein
LQEPEEASELGAQGVLDIELLAAQDPEDAISSATAAPDKAIPAVKIKAAFAKLFVLFFIR